MREKLFDLVDKIGDSVYILGRYTGQIISGKIVTVSISEEDIWLHLDSGVVVSYEQHIGKTVFLTKQEAKEALKGGAK